MMQLKPLTDYGWERANSELAIQWDTEGKIEQIKLRQKMLLKVFMCYSKMQLQKGREVLHRRM